MIKISIELEEFVGEIVEVYTLDKETPFIGRLVENNKKNKTLKIGEVYGEEGPIIINWNYVRYVKKFSK